VLSIQGYNHLESLQAFTLELIRVLKNPSFDSQSLESAKQIATSALKMESQAEPYLQSISKVSNWLEEEQDSE
jgi:hypothetical protein